MLSCIKTVQWASPVLSTVEEHSAVLREFISRLRLLCYLHIVPWLQVHLGAFRMSQAEASGFTASWDMHFFGWSLPLLRVPGKKSMFSRSWDTHRAHSVN